MLFGKTGAWQAPRSAVTSWSQRRVARCAAPSRSCCTRTALTDRSASASNGHQNGRENTGFSIGPLRFEDAGELDEDDE